MTATHPRRKCHGCRVTGTRERVSGYVVKVFRPPGYGFHVCPRVQCRGVRAGGDGRQVLDGDWWESMCPQSAHGHHHFNGVSVNRVYVAPGYRYRPAAAVERRMIVSRLFPITYAPLVEVDAGRDV